MIKLNKEFINEHLSEMIEKLDQQDEFILPERIMSAASDDVWEKAMEMPRVKKYQKEHRELRHERRRITSKFSQNSLVSSYFDGEVLDFVEAFPEFQGVIEDGVPKYQNVWVLDDSILQKNFIEKEKEILAKEIANLEKK